MLRQTQFIRNEKKKRKIDASHRFVQLLTKGRRKLERQTIRINHERNRSRENDSHSYRCTLSDGASNRLQVVVDLFR